MSKEIMKHLIAVLVLISVSSAFFWPYFEGKRIYQSDMAQYRGMSQEISRFEKITGKKPLWTNAMFGGMPSYQIDTPDKGNYLFKLNQFLRFGRENQNPVGFLVTGMLCMYILLVILKVDFRLAIIGGIAFGLATNNIILYEAGHLSKLSAVSYLPILVAGLVLTFRGRYWWGFFLFAIGFGLNLSANHIQITYYFFLTIPFLLIAEFFYLQKIRRLSQYVSACAVLSVGFLLAVGSNVCNLWTTYEYSKETVRGNSILTTSEDEFVDSTFIATKNTGLDYNYAMEWSNGSFDLLACIIPGAAGSATRAELFSGSRLFQDLSRSGFVRPDKYHAPLYWGSLPFTSGPTYFGIVLFFFFIIGLFIIEGPIKWWMGISVALIILLSMGKNFPALNQFVFDHLPFYNRFRTPNSILSIAPVLITLLGLMGMHKLLSNYHLPHWWPLIRKISIRFAFGLLALALLGPYLFSFSSPLDLHYQSRGFDLEHLISDRKTLFIYDTLRSLGIILLIFLLLWVCFKRYIAPIPAILAIGLLVGLDFWTVNRRFIDQDSFQQIRKYEHAFDPRPVDLEIARDTDLDFRVLDWTINTFGSASTSFHHNTIGGYHAAKLRRYQDVIERYLLRGDRGVINMLNTKYIVQLGGDGIPELYRNQEAMGNAWTVDSIQMVNSADLEIEVLDSIDLTRIAVVHQEYSEYLQGLSTDRKAAINLIEYQPDHLIYTSEGNTESLAVFSEIWYGPDKGWYAYLDGQPVEHIRANYLLRAMRIPAGMHRIEFVFKPLSFYKGRIISKISSSFILYGFIWFIGLTLFTQSRNAGAIVSKKKKRDFKTGDEKSSQVLDTGLNTLSKVKPIAKPPASTPVHLGAIDSPGFLKPGFLSNFFKISSLIVLIIMISLSMGSGVNADDEFQTDYSEKLVRFYTTLGRDTSALYIDKGKMHLYGGVFDLSTGMINHVLGFDQYDAAYHRVRHLFIALLGFLVIWFSSLLAKEIGGWRAAIFTLLFLFLSPRFLGHSLMNPKDIPFAAGYIIAIYFMIRFFIRFPSVRRNDVIGLILGIGLALGTRAGGLMLIVFFLVFGSIHFLLNYGFRNWSFWKIASYLKYLIPISLSGYMAAILCWPAALLNPLHHPLLALTTFSNLEIYIRLLFEGENIMSNQIPTSYIFIWMWRTLPLYCIVGIVGSIAFFNTLMKKYSTFPLAILYTTGIFPALYIAIQHSVLHDGWRHLLFIYPSLVIIAALFWVALTNYLRENNVYRYIGLAFITFTCIESGLFIARNHHYPYVYFNPMAGGIKKAFGYFETDYWGLGVKQAIDWMEDQKILDPGMVDTLTIATSFYYNVTHQLDATFRNKVRVRYLRYADRFKEDWDYAIYPSRFIPGNQLRSGDWPPRETVHVVRADGVPLVAVLKGKHEAIQLGLKASMEKNWSSDISLYASSLIQFLKNEGLIRGLAIDKIYNYKSHEAIKLVNRYIEITGSNSEAFSNMGSVKQSTQDREIAKKRYCQAIEKNATCYPAYDDLSWTDHEEDPSQAALDNGLKGTQIKTDFAVPCLQVGQIYVSWSNAEKADFY